MQRTAEIAILSMIETNVGRVVVVEATEPAIAFVREMDAVISVHGTGTASPVSKYYQVQLSALFEIKDVLEEMNRVNQPDPGFEMVREAFGLAPRVPQGFEFGDVKS